MNQEPYVVYTKITKQKKINLLRLTPELIGNFVSFQKHHTNRSSYKKFTENLVKKIVTKLKITTEKNHYFLYSSFFQKNDYRLNHIEANDIGHWSQVIGILFNIDLFDEFIMNQ